MNIALEYTVLDQKNWRKNYYCYFYRTFRCFNNSGNFEIMKMKLEKRKKLYSCNYSKRSNCIVPVLHTREGEIISELKKLIEEEGINVLVLAANTNENEKNLVY